jgi:hypothetical protein
MPLRILDRLEEIIIASLMAAATILIFVSVVHRFGTSVPFLYPYLIAIHISWAQELCIYMFIWMAKFGAAYAHRRLNGGEVRARTNEHRSGLARPRIAELAGLRVYSARLLFDVLPLSPGVMDLLQNRRPAAP